MAEAVAIKKPMKVLGIIPNKIQDKINEIKDNHEMDRIMKEVYAELGIKDIKKLTKDFKNFIEREEEFKEPKAADDYYRNKEISDFAERCAKADKRSIRNELLAVGLVAGTFALNSLDPKILIAVEAIKATIMSTCPWLVIPIAAIPAAIVIKRLIKSKKGNTFDGSQKREETDKALLDLVSKLEQARNEIESRKEEFLNAKRQMQKQEYIAWVKNEIKTIVSRVNGLAQTSLFSDINELANPVIENSEQNNNQTPKNNEEPKVISNNTQIEEGLSL